MAVNAMKAPLLVFALAVSPLTGILADDYLGSQAALEKAARIAASLEKKKDSNKDKDTPEQIATDREAFKASLSTLTPEAAASEWLSLVDRAYQPETLRSSMMGNGRRLEFNQFVEVLPSPPAWKLIAKAVTDRKSDNKAKILQGLSLRWFSHRLLGDTPALLQDYAEITSFAEGFGPEREYFVSEVVQPLEKEIFAVCDDGDTLLGILHKRLALASQPQKGGRDGYHQEFQIPDLVSLVGQEKASEFLARALTTLPQTLSIEHAEDTRKLAAQLALQHISELKAAQWELADSMDAGELYAALLKKFGAPTQPQDPAFERARVYEFLRLIMALKTAEATDLGRQISENFSLPSQGLDAVESAGRGKAVCEILHAILAENPALPYWNDYTSLAVRAGASEQMLALLKTTLARTDLAPEVRSKLAGDDAKALLAAGQVEAGVKALTELSAPIEKKSASPLNRLRRSEMDDQNIPLRVARIGQLMDRKDWIDLGLSKAEAKFQDMLKAPEQSAYLPSFVTSYAALLLDLQRGPEAEGILVQTLGNLEAKNNNITDMDPREFRDPTSGVDILCGLAGLYYSAGRYADILVLLDQAPAWAAQDLSQIATQRCYLGQQRYAPLGVCAAKALAAAGKKDEALRILRTLLAEDGGNDRIYELLIELDSANAMALLDQTFARDQFEERPLIWKADLQLKAGKLDEAEQTARAAIKIDPSDGEQGAGDRMRVYAILADVLDARGDKKNADFFRGVVEAIRLSEHADLFQEQGLISQAIALYEKSLTYFSDAYCIQSRLARQLSEQGDWKAAEEHYRRAYELMPDSFGRVESHCFGCERAFNGGRQQSIAERIFTGMAAKEPNKPQIYYLLGYLRAENENYTGALPEFLKAVELDPDYLNAWKQLSELAGNIHLPADLRNKIAANLLRLDPRQRHTSLQLNGVTDLTAVWTALEKISQAADAPPASLYPLERSAKAIAALTQKVQATKNPYASYIIQRMDRNDNIPKTPGVIFGADDFSRATATMLDASAQLLMMFPE